MRPLAETEIETLLANDADLRRRVQAQRQLVVAGGWDQIALAARDDVPVPVRGYVATDIWLGPVLVAPDAGGELHYIALEGYGPSVVRSIQQAAYASPDAGFAAFMNDLLTRANAVSLSVPSIPDLTTIAGLGVGLALAIWLLK